MHVFGFHFLLSARQKKVEKEKRTRLRSAEAELRTGRSLARRSSAERSRATPPMAHGAPPTIIICSE